jgi:hypothetical protein
VLGLLLVCGTLLWLLMPVPVGGRLRVLVLVGCKCLVYHMGVVAAMSMEGVRLPMVTMIMLLGRSQA